MRHLPRIIALGTAAVVVLSGALTPGRTQASTAATPGVTSNQIVIGTSLPLSGLATAYSVLAGAEQVYFNYVNAHGGVNGRKIKLIKLDDGYDPTRTLANARTLVQSDNVFALLGVVGTANNIAIQSYLTAQKVPNIIPFSGSSAVIHPLRKYVFTYQPSYTVEAKVLMDYAVTKLHAKKIGVFYQDDEFGKEGLSAVSAEAAKDGASVVASASYELTDVDMTAQVQALQQAQVDTVLLFAVPPDASFFLSAAARLGFKANVNFLSTSVGGDLNVLKLIGPAGDGVYFSNWLPDYLQDKASASFRTILAKYGNPKLAPLSPITEAGFAGAQILVEGLKRAGRNLTRDGLVKALEGLHSCGVCIAPNVKYSSKKHDGPEGVYIVKTNNGAFTPVQGYVYPPNS